MLTKHRTISLFLYISPFTTVSPTKVSIHVFAPFHDQLAPLGLEVVLGMVVSPGVVWETDVTSGVDPFVVVGLNGVVRSVVIVVVARLSVVVTGGVDCAVVGEVIAIARGIGVVVVADLTRFFNKIAIQGTPQMAVD